MTKFIRDKRQITQTVLDELPFKKDDNELEVAMFRWWRNIREDGGLRLDDEGDKAFTLAGLEYWDYTIDKSEVNKIANMSGVLDMDRNMPCPYYLRYDKTEKILKLRLYDSRVAMMIQLHGSIVGYLNSLKNKLNNDER